MLQAHEGVANWQLRAKSCLFWPNFNKDIKGNCRSVKFVKKAKTHKPKKHWNHMKYPLDYGKLLVLIYSHGMGTNICFCVIITLSFPSTRKYIVDSPLDKQL